MSTGGPTPITNANVAAATHVASQAVGTQQGAKKAQQKEKTLLDQQADKDNIIFKPLPWMTANAQDAPFRDINEKQFTVKEKVDIPEQQQKEDKPEPYRLVTYSTIPKYDDVSPLWEALQNTLIGFMGAGIFLLAASEHNMVSWVIILFAMMVGAIAKWLFNLNNASETTITQGAFYGILGYLTIGFGYPIMFLTKTYCRNGAQGFRNIFNH